MWRFFRRKHFSFFFFNWHETKDMKKEAWIPKAAHCQLSAFSGINFQFSPHSPFLLSFILSSLSARHSSFHYAAQGSRADIRSLHRGGTWTWATAGHTSHTSLPHPLFGPGHERELWEELLGWQHTTQLGWKSDRNVRRESYSDSPQRWGRRLVVLMTEMSGVWGCLGNLWWQSLKTHLDDHKLCFTVRYEPERLQEMSKGQIFDSPLEFQCFTMWGSWSSDSWVEKSMMPSLTRNCLKLCFLSMIVNSGVH